MSRKRIASAAAVWIGLGLTALLPAKAAADDEQPHRQPVHVESLKNAGFESGTDDWSVHVYGRSRLR